MATTIFDWKEYVSLNPDLQQAGIDTKEKAEKHWLDFGFNEKRLYKVVTVPADFDWQQYIANYPDLQQAGVDTKEKAEDHYVKFGYFERRSYAKPSAN